MFTSFGEFISCIVEARFTFRVIWEWIVGIFTAMTVNPDLSSIWGWIINAVAPIKTIVVSILILCSLTAAFFGKKIMPVIKFVLFFVIGFVIGAHFLTPLLPPEIHIPAWIIGMVLALILAVLAKFLYIVVYVIAIGYGSYVISYYGFFFNPSPVYSSGRALASLIVALVVLILAFIFKKYVEMAYTSILGAWGAVSLFAYNIYNFAAWGMFGGKQWIGILILTVIIAVLGMIVQVKTRRRY